MTRTERANQPVPELTLDTTRVKAEHAERVLGPLLTAGDGPVTVTFEHVNEISSEYVETFFDALMRSAMAIGGRRRAVEWMRRLRLQDQVEERAHRTMARTIDLDLRFGMLSPPLAVQAGCRPDLLVHEQQDADCIARLAVHGIATDGEVHKMRLRLVKRIVRAVGEDTQPQTVGTRDSHARENALRPVPAGLRSGRE